MCLASCSLLPATRRLAPAPHSLLHHELFPPNCIISNYINIFGNFSHLHKTLSWPPSSFSVLLYSKNSLNPFSVLQSLPLVLSWNHSSQALPRNTSPKLLSCWRHWRTLMLWNPVIRSVLITAWVDLPLLWKYTFFTWFQGQPKLLGFVPLHWQLLSLFCLLHLILSTFNIENCGDRPQNYSYLLVTSLVSSVHPTALNTPVCWCLSNYIDFRLAPTLQIQSPDTLCLGVFAFTLFPRMLSFRVFISHSLTSCRCLPLCHLLTVTFQDLTFSRCAFPALLFSRVLITTRLTLYCTCLFAGCLLPLWQCKCPEGNYFWLSDAFL